MANTAFSDGDMLRYGWNTMKERIGFFIGAFIVSGLAIIIPFGIGGALYETSGLLTGLFFLAGFVINIIIGVGWVKIVLDIVDGKEPGIGDLFKHWNLAWNYFLVQLLYMIVTFAGFFLLVFPAYVWGMRYIFAPYLVIDKGMKPMEAWKESRRITDGMKWDVFAHAMLVGLVAELGVFVFFVGLFATLPTAWLSMTKVYRHLAGASGKAS